MGIQKAEAGGFQPKQGGGGSFYQGRGGRRPREEAPEKDAPEEAGPAHGLGADAASFHEGPLSKLVLPDTVRNEELRRIADQVRFLTLAIHHLELRYA